MFLTRCHEFPFPATRGHLPRGATFAPIRRWPLVAATTVLTIRLDPLALSLLHISPPLTDMSFEFFSLSFANLNTSFCPSVVSMSSNYTTLCNEILRSKNKHMPSKWVKFNKYKHKKSSWITQGLLKSIKYRDKLYKRLKLTDPNSANYDTINIDLKHIMEF